MTLYCSSGSGGGVGPITLVFLFLGLVVHTWARPAVSVGLPPAVYADTETTTNVPFMAAIDVSGHFSFTLSCHATPSNNVEAAFGTDVNANGILDIEEVDLVVGWDCGSWFTRRKADGAPVTAQTDSLEGVRTLAWKVKTDMDGTPSRLFVCADEQAVFSTLPIMSTYGRSWNLLRLTARGLDASLENFSIVVTPDGTAIIMR